MTIYDLKPRFQSLLRPLANMLVAFGFTPNQVTLTALFLSGSAGILLALYPDAVWPLCVLPGVLFARMALNALDGMMAREHEMQSVLGQYLNEVGDVVSDLLLYSPLILRMQEPIAMWLFAFVLIGMVAAEVTGILAQAVSGVRRYDGPMGKSDRAFFFGLLALSLAIFDYGSWINWMLSLCIVLHLLTVRNRYRRAIKTRR